MRQSWLVWVVPARILLDLAAGVPIGPWSLAQLGSGVLFGVLLLAVLRGGTAARAHPVAPFLATYTACIAVGALRAESGFDALQYGLHLLTPVAWLLALSGAPKLPPEPPRSWWACALVPIGLSWVALVAGQPGAYVLHGWPRLIGPYHDLHPHADAMAVFASAAWMAPRSPLRGAVAIGATVALGFTFVRTGWLWVLLAGLAFFVVRGTPVRALALGVAAVCAATVIPAVRDRFADAFALASATPPTDGWGSLGSWRVRIWTESLAAWASGPWDDRLLGRGLGGQYGLHRHLDVHSDWLALWVQLGPAGLAAWLALHGALLWQLWRRRQAEAFALLLAGTSLAAVSNDWLVRGTPVIWTYAWVGLALRTPAYGGTGPASPRSG